MEVETGGACSTNGEEERIYVIGGKRPPGSSRRRRVDNIKMDLEEIERAGTDWLRIGTSGGLL
jgi:hypothetical protein